MSTLPPGAAVLDEVAAFVARYVAFPTEHALTAVTLWAAHTHAVGCFYVTPRLVLDSAEPGSGKTRVLELLNLLCRHPEMTISISTAALFRLISAKPHTILFDEVDAIFNARNGGNYEDLRALLNAGYKRGATIARCVGDAKSIAVQRFSVFSPVALAGLAGNMPATILTRAVTIHMRRRARTEQVEPFEEQEAEQLAEPIRERLEAWAADVADTLAAARPVMPYGVVDRAAEVWRALLAVADAAGDRWPDAGREACRHFALTASAPPTLGTRLLADLRTVFAGRDRMRTEDILEALYAIETAPWADLGGKHGTPQPLDSRRLAKELERFEVARHTFKDDANKAQKGYVTWPTAGSVGLADAWDRYLRDQVTDVAVTTQDSVTALTREVTEVTEVTEESRHTNGHHVTSPAAQLTLIRSADAAGGTAA